ncbi:hypothetical protein PFLUV_G00162520 [Perca fluviatilis]|uniref:Uncharacterized protein n=1 Tax=Perca fluviatilis TaxID=8168 RepID=A0A6A5EMU3_PERFL|nr:lysosome-associated membrane glycoprotein 1 isoform X1 [Perca fluviatilis]KAF1380328.1 hypothetical protein PFLUV_G00162520 [Perca fluviatilis]
MKKRPNLLQPCPLPLSSAPNLHLSRPRKPPPNLRLPNLRPPKLQLRLPNLRPPKLQLRLPNPTTPKAPTTTPKPTTPKAPTTTPKPTTPKAPTTTPKPTTPKAPTTTPKPTTTKAPTTTPKTTTTKAPTTTPKTTTTKAPTTTPKTTTTKPPTTTTTPKTPPQPTPPTELNAGNYSLTDEKTKVVCVKAHMALQIRLATPKANGTFIVQPKSTNAVGGCQATQANLTLAFKEGLITFMFNKNTEKVYVDALSFTLNYPLDKKVANGPPYSGKANSTNLFAAKIGHSYSCRNESLDMGNGLYLDITEDQMQAFNLTKSNEFGTPDLCPADKPNYSVAIAVGVTLLVLIIIVVVAYLLGRRKRADGYQSL